MKAFIKALIFCVDPQTRVTLHHENTVFNSQTGTSAISQRIKMTRSAARTTDGQITNLTDRLAI